MRLLFEQTAQHPRGLFVQLNALGQKIRAGLVRICTEGAPYARQAHLAVKRRQGIRPLGRTAPHTLRTILPQDHR